MLFVFDRVDEAKVTYGARHPRGNKDWPLAGIFAQRGKARPNRLGSTVCRLVGIEGLTILVEGLDAIYIGPSDLSIALGCKPAFEDVEPPVAQAIQHIIDRAKAHKVVAAIHNGTPEGALQRIGMGFQFVTISSDARLMAAGAQAVVAKMRSTKVAEGSKSY